MSNHLRMVAWGTLLCLAQVFFFHAMYMGGEVQLDPKELVDYAWVTKAEMGQYLSPELMALVKHMLMH